MSTEDAVPIAEYIDNPSERQLWVFVVDCTGPLAADNAVRQLNKGLTAFASELHGPGEGGRHVRLKVIRCVRHVETFVETLVDWTDAADFAPHPFKPHGKSLLGQAVNLALDEIESETRLLQQAGVSCRPATLFVFTGEPLVDHHWASAAERCRQMEKSNRMCAHVFALDGADIIALELLSNDNPLVNFSCDQFVELFMYFSRKGRPAISQNPTIAQDTQATTERESSTGKGPWNFWSTRDGGEFISAAVQVPWVFRG
jgi:uncharacterized protein YegL